LKWCLAAKKARHLIRWRAFLNTQSGAGVLSRKKRNAGVNALLAGELGRVESTEDWIQSSCDPICSAQMQEPGHKPRKEINRQAPIAVHALALASHAAHNRIGKGDRVSFLQMCG
jgi:hypothetical protein